MNDHGDDMTYMYQCCGALMLGLKACFFQCLCLELGLGVSGLGLGLALRGSCLGLESLGLDYNTDMYTRARTGYEIW